MVWDFEKEPPDVALLVALQEEFRELQHAIGTSWEARKDEVYGGYVYFWTDPGSGVRCVAASSGRMGPDESVRLSEKLLRWQPAVLVNVGIAASLHADARIGDVIVPDMVYAYDKTAKAIPVTRDGVETWEWERRGDAFRTTHALVELARELAYSEPGRHSAWQATGAAEYTAIRNANRDAFQAIETTETLKVLRAQPEVRVVYLGSGNFVGVAPAFARWMRSANADIKALEMEAAGMLLSSEKRATPTPALVIRGISDHIDVPKAQTDAIAEGAMRGLAMRNAIRLFQELIALPEFIRHGQVARRPLPVRATSKPEAGYSDWWMNTHKGGEIITILADDEKVVTLRPWAPPVRLSSTGALSPSNSALHRWRETGNAMRTPKHPWDHAGSALYRHEHGSHPRMLVFRTGSPPALLKYGEFCDLTKADIELDHNGLARRFIAEEKLVRISSPAEPTLDEQRYSPDLLAAGIAGVIDVGYFTRGGPIVLIDSETGREREATTEEIVNSLVVTGKRSPEIGLEVPLLEQQVRHDFDLLKVGPGLVAFTYAEFSEIHQDGLTIDEARLFLRHCVATGIVSPYREYTGGLFVGALPDHGEGLPIPSTPSPHVKMILGDSGWPTEATWELGVHNLSAEHVIIESAAVLWRFRDNAASVRIPIQASAILRAGNEFKLHAAIPLLRIKEFARSIGLAEPGKVDHAWIFAVLEVEVKLATAAATSFRVYKELPTLHDPLRDKRRFLYDPLKALRNDTQRAREIARGVHLGRPRPARKP